VLPFPRASGEDLIAHLFEEMHDLDFCIDSQEGAGFTLGVAMSKLGCDAGMVHLYDIDRREFVVVHAVGPGVAGMRGLRTAEADPLAAEALCSRSALLVLEPAGDARLSGQRWTTLCSASGRPLASVAVARAAQAGRFLGLIELAHLGSDPVAAPLTTGARFETGDENALTYIAERFAEFVAGHGVTLGEL
jgi:hypothetical protein